MKNIVTIIMVFATFAMFGQVDNKVEEEGNKVKVTKYYDNGMVKEIGFYENGKHDGEFTMFDVKGNKIALGSYTQGVKTGNWFFWNGTQLIEASYEKNIVVSAQNWKQNTIATKIE